MKKYFFKAKYKQHNKSSAAKSLKLRTKFKTKKKVKNRSTVGFTKSEVYDKKIEDRYRGFKKIQAPSVFSFLEQPEKLIHFVDQLRSAFDNRKKVFIHLRNVTKIDYDAIIVLFSIMIRFKSQKIDFNGDFPANKTARNTLVQSGFFEYLFKKNFSDVDQYRLIRANTIHTHANKNVDAELGEKIMENITPRVFGEKRVYKGLQRTLLELEQNCHNHATIGQEGDKHWWLSVSLKTQDKRATFAFIDYGVGIFTSLDNKGKGSKFYKWGVKMAQKYRYGNNADILKLILEGHLHSTVTGQHFRGKGLPGMKQAMDRNQISKLHIITNDVYADVEKDNYRLLKTSFEGTFVYWELNESNIYHPWIA